MKIPLLNIDGSKNLSIEISDKLIKLKVNHKLIKFVIDWQLNRAKPRLAKTKQRNQIKGSTVKIVAQKGRIANTKRMERFAKAQVGREHARFE